MGLRKVNTIGIEQANKCMQLSAIAYNLKKYMKFIEKRTKSEAGAQALYFSLKNTFYNLINMLLKPFKTPGFLSL
ncbi:transposase [Seonamhaeicola sp. NFXS20]